MSKKYINKHKISKAHYDQLDEARKRLYKSSDIDYEGTQYKGGRRAKNLIKLDDGRIKNEHGVVFTQEEKKRLESLVNSANAKRRRMLKEEGSLPRKVGNKDTGDTIQTMQGMNSQSDFIITRKTKSLQRFARKSDYDQYIEYLERVNQKNYVNARIAIYKENHLHTFDTEFNSDVSDIKEAISKMSLKEYKKFIQSHPEELDIAFNYTDDDEIGKANYYRSVLGLPLKEDYIEDI